MAGARYLRLGFKRVTRRKFVYNDKDMRVKVGQIRLITILPLSLSSDNSGIECIMSVKDLDTQPKYTALSYTWGSPKRPKAITINGKSLLVTESVEIALRRLRRERESVVLWVDQICINQDDDEEKGVQVSMMKQIYVNSSQTVIWLGPAADSSDTVMDFLNEVGREAWELGLHKVTSEFLDCSTSPVAEDDSSKDDPFANMKRKHELLYQRVKGRWPLFPYSVFIKRPWFSRIWIVQEFSVSGEVILICGDREITYTHFRDAHLFSFIYRARLVQDVANVTTHQRLQTQEAKDRIQVLKDSQTGHIQELLSNRQKFQKLYPDPRKVPLRLNRILKQYQVTFGDDFPRLDCKDPRDRIFGLLGIAEDSEELGLCADYHKSCQEVYTDTARKMIQAGYVDILAQSQWPKSLDNIPSWVPDWTGTIYEPIGDVYHQPVFETSRKTKQRVQDDKPVKSELSLSTVLKQEPSSKKVRSLPDEKALYLDGIYVDEIETVGRVWDQDEDTDAFLQGIKELCIRSRLKDKKIYKTEARRNQAEWRIPVVDQEVVKFIAGRATSRSEHGYNLELEINKMRLEASNGSTTINVDDFAKLAFDPTRRMYAQVLSEMRNRRAYLTTQGYVGLGPIGMQAGDRICILLGANFPYILRLSEDSASYNFVGEAYCDGIMDGEFMDSNPTEETFKIY
jgi:hypothetical protein